MARFALHVEMAALGVGAVARGAFRIGLLCGCQASCRLGMRGLRPLCARRRVAATAARDPHHIVGQCGRALAQDKQAKYEAERTSGEENTAHARGV